MRVERIDVARIKVMNNSRETDHSEDSVRLMDSINKVGLKQPIGITLKKGEKDYILVYGHRRFAAIKKLGWLTVPAVLHDDLASVDIKVLNMVENMQRKNPTPAELGRYCLELEKEGLSLSEIAVRLSYPLTMIKDVVSVYTQLPESIRSKVKFQKSGKGKRGTIPVSVATKLLNAQRRCGLSKETVGKLADKVRKDQLSGDDIRVIGGFIQGGMSPDKAILHQKKFKMFRVDVVAYKDEVEMEAAKSGMSTTEYLEAVVFGEKKHLTRPEMSKRGGFAGSIK